MGRACRDPLVISISTCATAMFDQKEASIIRKTAGQENQLFLCEFSLFNGGFPNREPLALINGSNQSLNFEICPKLARNQLL